MLLMFSIAVHAQQDVTQFLGIQVDGSKFDMMNKLLEKGYRRISSKEGILEGQFNGRDVRIYVATNKNKVCRIMLCDAYEVNETNIKIRFNKLCEQFENNPKYVAFEDYTIPEKEDISYEMTVNNKRYEAIFYQKPIIADSVVFAEELRSIFLSKYPEELLENPTEKVQSDMLNLSLEYMTELSLKKPVWFMISGDYGKYSITMYYDNTYNQAKGEDL